VEESAVIVLEPEPVIVAVATPVAAPEVAPSVGTAERPWPSPDESAAPDIPRRPKRGPKKRKGGIPALLRGFAVQPGQGDSAAANAVAPHESSDGPQAVQPPFDDKKP
jgi:hypothetical protein